MILSFKHSGDVGDVLYSLPTMRALGGGRLYLSPSNKTRLKISQKTVDSLKPLLEAQPYVKEVLFNYGESHTYELDCWRLLGSSAQDYKANIAHSHLKAFNIPLTEADVPWISIPPRKVAEVVINCTSRYRNRFFPWKSVVKFYRDKCVFVGHPDEHRMFCLDHGDVPYVETKNHRDLAEVIAGAKLFIGNQSTPFAIAEAMKKNAILEMSLELPNCNFKRNNLTLVPGGRVKFPKL